MIWAARSVYKITKYYEVRKYKIAKYYEAQKHKIYKLLRSTRVQDYGITKYMYRFSLLVMDF